MDNMKVMDNPLTDALWSDLADMIADRVYERLKREPPMVEQIVLSAVEVGKMIGRTARAVLQMYYNGQIPGFKIGNKIGFDKRKIVAWLDELQSQ